VYVARPAAGQATYTWQSSPDTLWFNAANWAGGPPGTAPGVTTAGLPTDGTATDVARFSSFPQGASNGVAIAFAAVGGRLALGAIQFDDNLGGLTIGNSSAAAGTLRLNGATVGGVSNVLIANTSLNYSSYAISPLPNGGTGGPGLALELGTADGVFLTVSSTLHINVPITEAAPGYGFSVRGGYTVALRGSNTFSGPVRVLGSVLNINADDRLGQVPAAATAGRLVLEPAGGFHSVLDTNAATFEIHANRGIAIGPTTGTGAAEIHVPDPDVPGYTPVVTYNGVIDDNGSGSGRLIKTGGGVLVLGGANAYGGGTTIDKGTVLVTNATGSGTGTAGVTVNAGGTLGGTGRVAPQPSFTAVPTLLNGGTLQAGGTGTAAPTRTDVLSITQQLKFDGAATLRTTVGQSGGVASAGKIDLAAGDGQLARDTGGATADRLTIRLTNDGTLDLSGNTSYTVTVLNYHTLDTGSLSEFTNQTNPAYFAVAADNFTLAGDPLVSLSGGDLSVTFTPVPEPGAVLAVAAGGLALALRRPGRRRADAVG